MDKKYYLTQEGFEEKKAEYEKLKTLRTSKISEDVPRILESEDLNPEYVSFQEDMGRIDGEIAELENIFKNAIIIDSKKMQKVEGAVNVGSKILVEINGKDEDEFTIVGTLEAQPTLGKISNESPVGKALLGHRAGEVVIVSSPLKATYKIKKILSS